jgi:hypothetical protein
VISTPFGKRGLFWDQYRLATDQQGVNSDVKVYDLYPSTINPLISEEDMERERLNLTEMEFRQEYLGEFIEEVDVYCPLDLIMPGVDPTLQLLERGDHQTGVGEAVIEDFKRVVPNARGVVVSVTTKTEMAAGLRTLFEQRRIRLPNDKKLVMQINALRYQVSKAGKLLFESSEKGVHDDYLWALALACYAARETPLVVMDLFD